MMEDFLRSLGAQDTPLRSMELVVVNISSLSAQTVIRLEKLSLWNNKISPFQLNKIFSQIAENNNLRLSKLSLRGIRLDSLSPELLSRAVLRLQEVKLDNSS